jgi:sugar phosphate isomerase/epimerase
LENRTVDRHVEGQSQEEAVGEKLIGLNLYSLREFTQTAEGLADTLKRVADIGYDGVQISGIRDLEPEAIVEIVKTSGLPVAATHLAWDLFRDEIARAVEIHDLYNCRHAAIGSLPKDYFSMEGAERFLSELPAVTGALSSSGMDFSYHNHSHELARYDGETWLATVLAGSRRSALNFEIDTYWIQAGGGDPVQWIKRCGGRIPLLHVKDMIVTPDREQRFAPVGDGNLEWDSIFSAAENAGVEWYLVEEDTFYGADPFEDVARSCRFLRGALK